MKKCLYCQAVYNSHEASCSACHIDIVKELGLSIHAPEFLHQGGGFKEEYFAGLARLEGQNFWFKGRNRLILAMINKYAKDFSSYLEIGCGTGFVLAGIAAAFPKVKLHGSEIFIGGLKYAAGRVPNAECLQMDARNIPYQDEFDVVGAFDVLEHIEEDEKVLSQIHQALHEKGMLIMTVPQHDWLWSASDEYACHVRRYSAKEIETKITAAGFDVLRSTSFVSLLLPAMFISRQWNKKVTVENYDPMAEFNLPRWLNGLFEILLDIEVILIRLGINLPLGGTRLVIAKKRQK